jgi:hypothetical protein
MIGSAINLIFAYIIARHDKKAIGALLQENRFRILKESYEPIKLDYKHGLKIDLLKGIGWVFIAFFQILFNFGFGDVDYTIGGWCLVVYWVRYAAEFWLAFDIMLNLMLGKKWNYIDTDPKENNKLLDRMFKGRFWLQFATKIILIAATYLIEYIWLQ